MVKKLTTLGATPSTSERSFVDIEFRFSESTGTNRPARVRDLLYDRLGRDEFVDESAKGGILPRSELVDDEFEDEGRVSGPGEQVVRIGCAWTGNHHSCLIDSALTSQLIESRATPR